MGKMVGLCLSVGVGIKHVIDLDTTSASEPRGLWLPPLNYGSQLLLWIPNQSTCRLP